MTLIINAIWQRWAFHASDRFVSVPVTARNPTGEFDPHSNKTVIVVGSDCWLVMGYTGVAYLNGKPTDQVIAEAISGYQDLSGIMSTFWTPGPYLHYREIRNRIQSRLDNDYASLPRAVKAAHGITVLSSGLQRKGQRIKRVMSRIDVKRDRTTSSELAPRFMPWGGFQGSAVGTVHNSTMDKMGERLKRYLDRGGNDPHIFREVMMDAVRQTGAIVPHVVGQDAVGVYLDNSNRKISARFHPAIPARQMELLQRLQGLDPQLANRPTVSTPFVLMPGVIWGPSIGNPGGWQVMTDGGSNIEYEYSGFNMDASGPGGAFFAAQPRRLSP
ncbi:hypothetical protein [Mycobacterium marinum]|uniref:hypothetical protein n=1 Tax=Mycobacterium marinum TaxID=1781 RepID=UPI0035639CBA